MNQSVSLRNIDLDIIKGLLVFIMIFYHSASMAFNKSPELLKIADFIQFIHFAFLIITGFLCGWYYLPKLDSVSQKSVSKRLQIRALKIGLILITLNTFIYAFNILDFNKLLPAIATFPDLLNNLLLSVKGSLIAFEILLPIALFLLFASFILVQKNILIITFLFTGITLYLGQWGTTVNTIAFGGIGLIAGVLSQTEWVKKTFAYYKKDPSTSFIVFIGCICSILFLKFLYSSLPFHFYYTAEACCWFLGLLAIVQLTGSHLIADSLVLFGNYTLLGYISQMFIIRIIYKLLSNIGITGFFYYVTCVFISTIFLFLLLKVVDNFRMHYKSFNSTYRLIFQ